MSHRLLWLQLSSCKRPRQGSLAHRKHRKEEGHAILGLAPHS